MNFKVKLGLLTAIVAVGLFGPPLWRRIPPFERGVHELQVDAAVVPGSPDAPRIGSCPLFPADNIWNPPVGKMPVDGTSAAYLASIGDAKVHPDFGAALLSGIHYTIIPARTKRVPIQFDYRDDSDLSNYPIPPDAPIEGGPTPRVTGTFFSWIQSDACCGKSMRLTPCRKAPGAPGRVYGWT